MAPSCSPAVTWTTNIECPRPSPSAYRCASSSGTAWRLMAVQLSRSLRLSRSSILALSMPASVSALRAARARSAFSNAATIRSPDRSPALIRRAHCRGVHRAVSVQDRFDARPVGIGNPHGHERAAAPHAFSIGVSFLFADTGLRQRANQATGGSAGDGHCRRRSKPPAATTGPIPGMANRPRPASSPATPPSVAPIPAPVAAPSARSSRSVGIPIDTLRSVPIKPAAIVIRNDADIAVRNSRAFQLGNDACAGVMVLIKPRDGGH